MDKQLYELVRRVLMDNLDPEAGLREVVAESLVDRIEQSQVEEAEQHLLALLASLRDHLDGQRIA